MQWSQLQDHRGLCRQSAPLSRHADNHTNTSSLNFYRRMLFLTPNQQCHSTEGKKVYPKMLQCINHVCRLQRESCWVTLASLGTQRPLVDKYPSRALHPLFLPSPFPLPPTSRPSIPYPSFLPYFQPFPFLPKLGWRRGVVVSGVRQWTKLTHVEPGYNWDGWPSSGGYTISDCNQPTRSTQPCIPPGSLNRVPASAGVKAVMSPLPGGRWSHIPVWSHMARQFP